MILGVYSVYDAAAEAFLQPFFSQTVGSALRSFGDAVNNPETPMFKHTSDYSLFQLGEYNDLNGSLKGFDVPKKLITALEMKETKDA